MKRSPITTGHGIRRRCGHRYLRLRDIISNARVPHNELFVSILEVGAAVTDNNLWFTTASTQAAQANGTGAIFRITISALTRSWVCGTPASIAVGADGNLWFGDGSKRAISRFAPP